MRAPSTLPGYERLSGAPAGVAYAPGMEERAREVHALLGSGLRELSRILDEEPPELEALVVAREDWREAPRENARAYPSGLPYFTRSTSPPALVFPEELSPAFHPLTEATLPLVVWHELAHAFLLKRNAIRTPAWLRELVPQTAAAAVARRVGAPLAEHLSRIEREPGFTVRDFEGPADAERQMRFQNLLLLLGAAALERFGERSLRRLFRSLWEEGGIVDEERAEELLAAALGEGGRGWLASRPEF
jgi:hypothetical protein